MNLKKKKAEEGIMERKGMDGENESGKWCNHIINQKYKRLLKKDMNIR